MITLVGRSLLNGVSLRDGKALNSSETIIADMQTILDEMRRAYNTSLQGIPIADRPSDTRLLGAEFEMVFHATNFFSNGRNLFHLSHGLATALENTSLAGVRRDDIRIPHGFFYLSLGSIDCGCLGDSNDRIDGMYVNATSSDALQIVVTTRSADPSRPWPISIEPWMHVPLDLNIDGNPTFEDLLDRAISTGEIPVAAPGVHVEEDGSENVDLGPMLDDAGEVVIGSMVDVRRRKDIEQAVRNRNAMPGVKKALAILVNALAWLTSEPNAEAIEPEWGEDADMGTVADLSSPSKGRRRRAEASLLDKGFVPIRILGRDLQSPPTHLSLSGITGTSIGRAHWRIGHWRRQVCGPGRSERRLKWIMPVLVRADLGLDPESGGHAYTLGA